MATKNMIVIGMVCEILYNCPSSSVWFIGLQTESCQSCTYVQHQPNDPRLRPHLASPLSPWIQLFDASDGWWPRAKTRGHNDQSSPESCPFLPRAPPPFIPLDGEVYSPACEELKDGKAPLKINSWVRVDISTNSHFGKLKFRKIGFSANWHFD